MQQFSFLIYFFRTGLFAWLYKNFFLKLILITDSFTLKLLTILGCGPVYRVEFNDTAGNNYIVKLARQDSTVDLLIQALNTSDHISIDLYIESLNLNIGSLMAQVNALLDSAPLNMQTVADNTEVISIITDVSQLL